MPLVLSHFLQLANALHAVDALLPQLSEALGLLGRLHAAAHLLQQILILHDVPPQPLHGQLVAVAVGFGVALGGFVQATAQQHQLDGNVAGGVHEQGALHGFAVWWWSDEGGGCPLRAVECV